MHEMTRILLLIAALLCLPVALADDASNEDARTAALDSLLASDGAYYRPASLQRHAVPRLTEPLDGALEFKFQDMSALGRMKKLRSVSLLTLTETDRSRLFLGMNRRGLFGLHFGYTTRRSSERLLELARMPYLKAAAATE